MNFPMPSGLDASEQLAYRTSYSRIFGAYIKEHGAPSLPGKDKAALREHAAAWHAAHDEPRTTKSHLGGVRGVQRYWKRHGITGREHLIGKAPVARKPKTTTCTHCGLLTAVA